MSKNDELDKNLIRLYTLVWRKNNICNYKWKK